MTNPLPVALSPLPDESLLGFLGRLARVNEIGFGALRSTVTAHATKLYPAAFTVGTVFDLDHLAALAMEPREAIDELTFVNELARLYRTEAPSAKLLGRVILAICPLCWRTAPMHRRHHLLPGVDTCGVHGTVLRTSCDCHQALTISDRFLGLCKGCGRAWGEIDGRPADTRMADRSRRVSEAYRSILAGRDVTAERTRLRSARDGYRQETGTSLPLWLETVSVERLVGLHVALGADPETIAALRDDEHRPCPNAACANFDLPGASAKTVESHCRLCGSRFKGQRILTTFDLDHGQDRPSQTQVRRARRRLAVWRRSLRSVCKELVLSGNQVTVQLAFPAAGVPMNAYLRAPRLGLTSIVRAAEARRQDVAAPWRYSLQGRMRRAVARHERTFLLEWLAISVSDADVPLAIRRRPTHPLEAMEWLRVWR